jgi:hypothetical protein
MPAVYSDVLYDDRRQGHTGLMIEDLSGYSGESFAVAMLLPPNYAHSNERKKMKGTRQA